MKIGGYIAKVRAETKENIMEDQTDKLNKLLSQLRKLGFDMDYDGPDEENIAHYLGCVGNLFVSVSLMKDED